ncbi:hypothetical protein NEPAR04_1966 [Nematocida parisii]|nr:hypothetical protein NEPAR03_2024 [Nematocida parisii]KAI5143830.1 hypothetical protein NEPAR04_1966 [Nematocida parisii]
MRKDKEEIIINNEEIENIQETTKNTGSLNNSDILSSIQGDPQLNRIFDRPSKPSGNAVRIKDTVCKPMKYLPNYFKSTHQLMNNEITPLIKMNNYEIVNEDGVCLLKRVSLSIPEGKLVCLVGISQIEKVSLMESLAGLTHSGHTVCGDVFVKNEINELSIRNTSEWFLNVNYIEHTVINYKNTPMYSVVHSVAQCRNISTPNVNALIKAFRMEKAKNILFKNLTENEKRKVIIICGIMGNNKFNIWDEPFSNLGPEIINTVIFLMKKFKSTNLISIHEPSVDLLNQMDYAIIIHKSTVIYSGSVQNIKDYFIDKGICFPSDIPHINYIMKLCSNTSNNEQDTVNIRIFNEISERIITSSTLHNKQCKRRIWWIKSQVRVSHTKIFQILRRLPYFDKQFKGSSLTLDICVLLLCLFIGVVIMCLLFSNILIKNGVFKYENISSMDLVYKLHMIREYLINHAKYTEKSPCIIYCDNILRVISNNCWVHILQHIFTPIIMVIYTLSVILPGCMNKSEFYRNCKLSIKRNEFTAGDVIISQVLDILIRKTLLIFICKVSLYIFIYAYLDSNIKKYIRISHTLSITLLSISSVLLGIYLLIVHLIPYTYNIHRIILFLCILIPESVYNYIKPVWYKHTFINDIGIFRMENSLFMDGIRDMFGLNQETSLLLRCTYGLFWCARVLYKVSPHNCFIHLLQIVCVYNESIIITDTHMSKYKDNSSKLQDILHKLIKSQCTQERETEITNSFLSHIRDIVSSCKLPHEIFNGNVLLLGISIMYILKNIIVLFILPLGLLILVLIYSYAYLIPELSE